MGFTSCFDPNGQATSNNTRPPSVMEPLTFTAWIAALLLIPLIFILWLSESTDQKIVRYHRQGWSQRRIAHQLSVSRWTVRKCLAAGAAA